MYRGMSFGAAGLPGVILPHTNSNNKPSEMIKSKNKRTVSSYSNQKVRVLFTNLDSYFVTDYGQSLGLSEHGNVRQRKR